MAKGIELKYQVNDLPPTWELILQGLQWLVTAVPIFVMIAKVAAGVHYHDPLAQVIYIQKVLFISALALGLQVLRGHRLPLVIGPATVLLIAVTASSREPAVVYTAQIIGGAVLFLVSASGYFGVVKRLFTNRVVAVILMLIGVTLSPTIINLLFTGAGELGLARYLFTAGLLVLLFWGNRRLRGIWKTNLIFLGVLLGSLAYFLLLGTPGPLPGGLVPNPANIFTNLNLSLRLDLGTIVAYLFCFLALSVNDLGSIQSTAVLLSVEDTEPRITAGEGLTGLANIAAGFLGAVGVVNYSLSPGIISSTGSGSRYALLPTALGMLLIASFPGAISLVAAIPSVVIGCVLLYVMSSQIAAGLVIATADSSGFSYEESLIMGVPIMLALVVTFLPPAALASLPLLVRPLLGNSLVVGVVAVLLMEHVLYRR